MHTFIIEPAAYSAFEDEGAQIAKCKEWGLLSEKAVKTKTFVYKGNGMNLTCGIVGYVDKMTAVIEFDNSQKHCIHPAYLKEMQAANYGQKASSAADETAEPESAEAESPAAAEAAQSSVLPDAEKREAALPEEELTGDGLPETASPEATSPEATSPEAEPPRPEAEMSQPIAGEPVAEKRETAPPEAKLLDVPWDDDPPGEGSGPAQSAAAQPPKGKAGKAKAAKLELPEEKVKMKATVQEFTTVPNNFSDNDDEVVIYEAVSIVEPPLDIGLAWSSHSNTLKKLELAIGDTITFECKIVAKKLTKHPVPYKINNPAKIQKET